MLDTKLQTQEMQEQQEGKCKTQTEKLTNQGCDGDIPQHHSIA